MGSGGGGFVLHLITYMVKIMNIKKNVTPILLLLKLILTELAGYTFIGYTHNFLMMINCIKRIIFGMKHVRILAMNQSKNHTCVKCFIYFVTGNWFEILLKKGIRWELRLD